MSRSFETYSIPGSEIIDLEYLESGIKKQNKVGPTRSSSQHFTLNSQMSGRSHTKIGNQQVFNNFYLTVPSTQDLPLMGTDALKTVMSQVQKGLGSSLPLNGYLSSLTNPTQQANSPSTQLASKPASEEVKSIKGVNV